MSLSQVEKEIEKLQKELLDCNQERKKEIESQIKKQEEYYQHLSPYDHVYLARKSTRPNIKDYINHLFDDFIELHGDRLAKDDGSIVGGIGLFNQQPVTIIGHLKGKTLEDNLKCNFGMSSPEGYRKAMRLMKQAEKFKRPIIAFVDTPGAYPGMEAEMHGIGEAIARNLLEMSLLKVPIITIVIGEGGSGGALALSVSDRLVMLENSVYSILSPEGFASILWKQILPVKGWSIRSFPTSTLHLPLPRQALHHFHLLQLQSRAQELSTQTFQIDFSQLLLPDLSLLPPDRKMLPAYLRSK